MRGYNHLNRVTNETHGTVTTTVVDDDHRGRPPCKNAMLKKEQ